MLKIEEILQDWKTWLATLTLTIGGWWKYRHNKRKNAAETGKTEVERDIAKLKLKIDTDKYIEQIEAKFQKKIDSLILKLDMVEQRNEILQKQLDIEKITTQELRAELTMYKTLKSTKQ